MMTPWLPIWLLGAQLLLAIVERLRTPRPVRERTTLDDLAVTRRAAARAE